MAKNARGSIAKAVASLEDMVNSGVLGFQFNDSAKTVRELKLSDVYPQFDGLPYIAKMTMARGSFEKVRDTYAGSESVAEAIELTDSTMDELRNGRWFKARTVGPRLGELFDAATRVLTAAGKPAPVREAFDTKYADESARTRLREMPEIAAMLAVIAKEKADAKAAELAKIAQSATSNLDSI